MIKVLIQRNKQTIKKVKVTGHANSGEYGKDLVCCAVSTVCMGICNTLDHRGFLDEHYGRIELGEGNMEIEVFKVNDEHQIILQTCEIMMKTILETSSPKYIKIMEEENYEI